MNESKDIHIETSAFSLTVHWNPMVFFAQVCLLVGILLIWVFASAAVRRLMVALAVLDVLSIIVSLFFGAAISTSEPGQPAPTPVSAPTEESSPQVQEQPQEMDADDLFATPLSTPAREKPAAAPVSNQAVDGEIKNKVGVSNAAPTPAPVPPPPSNPASAPEPAQVQQDDQTMSDDDIADLFNF